MRERVKIRRQYYIISNIITAVGFLTMAINYKYISSIEFIIGILLVIVGVGFGEFIWRCPKCNSRFDPKDYNPKSCSKCKTSFK